jgi:hypothetical protein
MKKLFNLFSNKKYDLKNIQDESPVTKEFNENVKIITNEYGEDIVGLPHNYGTAKVNADLLKRIKQLEEKIK